MEQMTFDDFLNPLPSDETYFQWSCNDAYICKQQVKYMHSHGKIISHIQTLGFINIPKSKFKGEFDAYKPIYNFDVECDETIRQSDLKCINCIHKNTCKDFRR